MVALLSISIPLSTQVKDPADIYVPIHIQMIEKKQKQRVDAKKLVSNVGPPTAKKKPKPTSLPGDRLSPAIAQKVFPVYPKKALNNDWEGTVKVKVTVSKSGRPVSVRVISSSGHSILDRSFVRAIKKNYVFNPKRKMGKNMAGTIILSHTFSLKV